MLGEINSDEQAAGDTGGERGVVNGGAGTHRAESCSHQVRWEQVPEEEKES